MYRAPKPNEVFSRRNRYGTNVFLARRQLIRERLSSALNEATDIEDLREILRVMLNEMWEDSL